MFTGYLILALLVFITYSVVWRGDCRFACRPNMLDGGAGGRSAITGLNRRPSHPNNECSCEACPCEIVEAIVKSSRPIIEVYNSATESATQYYNNVADMLQHGRDHFSSYLECSTSCQRQAQLATTRFVFDPNENFKLVPKSAVKGESRVEFPLVSSVSDATKYGAELVATISEIALKISKSLDPDIVKVPIAENETRAATSSARPPVVFADKPSTSSKTFLGSIEEIRKRVQISEREREREDEIRSVGTEAGALVETLTLSGSLLSLMNCSKCVAEGKTCIGGCPSAKRKQDKRFTK